MLFQQLFSAALVGALAGSACARSSNKARHPGSSRAALEERTPTHPNPFDAPFTTMTKTVTTAIGSIGGASCLTSALDVRAADESAHTDVANGDLGIDDLRNDPTYQQALADIGTAIRTAKGSALAAAKSASRRRLARRDQLGDLAEDALQNVVFSLDGAITQLKQTLAGVPVRALA
jgi:hypothetical protein